MNRDEVDDIVALYVQELDTSVANWPSTQYDDRSAKINYSFIRHFKPKVVVEFGSNTGRCTYDILRALIQNGGEFTFKSYEVNAERRLSAQSRLNESFGDKSIQIGEDITKANDVPQGIDYLFIDNNHDLETTRWAFDTLLKRCVPNCLIQIHDIPLRGNFEVRPEGRNFEEVAYIIDLQKEGKLPFKKEYWTWEENTRAESSWWRLV
jgi:predicted O-methyltransferase YrrM